MPNFGEWKAKIFGGGKEEATESAEKEATREGFRGDLGELVGDLHSLEEMFRRGTVKKEDWAGNTDAAKEKAQKLKESLDVLMAQPGNEGLGELSAQLDKTVQALDRFVVDVASSSREGQMPMYNGTKLSNMAGNIYADAWKMQEMLNKAEKAPGAI